MAFFPFCSLSRNGRVIINPLGSIQRHYQTRQVILKLVMGYHIILPHGANYKGKETSALRNQSLKQIQRSLAFLFCNWGNNLTL